MLKKSASDVLTSLRGSTYRSVRLASSLAAALLDGLFEHPATILTSAPSRIFHKIDRTPLRSYPCAARHVASYTEIDNTQLGSQSMNAEDNLQFIPKPIDTVCIRPGEGPNVHRAIGTIIEKIKRILATGTEKAAADGIGKILGQIFSLASS